MSLSRNILSITAPLTLGITVACSAQAVDPRAAVPLTDSTLSVLEPKDARCEWLRIDPVAGKKTVIASFAGTCTGAIVAFSHDQSKALVRFDPERRYAAAYFSQAASKPNHADEPRTTVDEGPHTLERAPSER